MQLIKIITDDDDNLDNSLFDSNVRGFHKENEVNSSIATTLESSSDIDKGLDDEKGYHQISIFDDDPSFDE